MCPWKDVGAWLATVRPSIPERRSTKRQVTKQFLDTKALFPRQEYKRIEFPNWEILRYIHLVKDESGGDNEGWTYYECRIDNEDVSLCEDVEC